MLNTATLETYEQLVSEQADVKQLPISMERKVPATPFPRKFVLSVFANLQDARQAANTLRMAGYDEQEIYILQGHEFVKSVTQDQSPFEPITAIDYDIYLREVRRGRFFLVVRPCWLCTVEPDSRSGSSLSRAFLWGCGLRHARQETIFVIDGCWFCFVCKTRALTP